MTRAINKTQRLKHFHDWRGVGPSMDFRMKKSDLRGRVRLYRAKHRDRAGLKAYVFGVRSVTPHVELGRTRATAHRSIVGVALFGRTGKPIIDGAELRVRRTDPPPSRLILHK